MQLIDPLLEGTSTSTMTHVRATAWGLGTGEEDWMWYDEWMSLTTEPDIYICAGDKRRSDNCLTLWLLPKRKATSKSYCYSLRWNDGSGYSWLRTKLKETLSAMLDVWVMLLGLTKTIGRLIKRGAALSCCFIFVSTHLLLRWTLLLTWQTPLNKLSRWHKDAQCLTAFRTVLDHYTVTHILKHRHYN